MEQTAKAYISLSIEAQKALFVDVHHRSTIEACGVLLGTIDEQGNWHVEQAYPLRNIFASPVYFEFAPEDLLTVEMEHPDRIIGVYHSHPTGFARASNTDRENMERVNKQQGIPWVWCIIRGPFTHSETQEREERITPSSIVAYHHYEHRGLQKISVVIEDIQSNKTNS
jgi:proteasome lid subunit RPN8/RPN11